MEGCNRPAVKLVDGLALCQEHVEFWTKPGAFDPSKLPARPTTKR
jgi:hypothetical protein